MISSVSFKNYKVFKDRQLLELGKITVLIGKNNTGKSAVLKLMSLIEQGLNTDKNQLFGLENNAVRVGNDYRDLIYGKFSRAFELGISQKDKLGTTHTLDTSILVNSKENTPILERWKLSKVGVEGQNENLLDLENKDLKTFVRLDDGLDYSCNFHGLRLVDFSRLGSTPHLEQPKFNFCVDFIGAIRSKPKLDYRLSHETEKSGIDGGLLYDFLIRDYLTTDKLVFNSINKWLSEKFEGWSLYIDADGEPYHVSLRRDSLEIDLTETGMGIGQSLPLIIRAFRACLEEMLIVLEEPEAHLHPYAHSEMAQLIAESIKKDLNKNYLIETHSQNFILRLRRLVAEGFLGNKDLLIYYVDFDEEKNESSLKRIIVDERGGVEWWPDGIFSETNLETRAIYKAQINDLGHVGRNK
jgi:predicted ATPase